MTELLTFLLIVLSILLVILLLSYISSKRKLDEVHSQVYSRAQAQYESWRKKELDALFLEQKQLARREAMTELEQWKVEHESAIRQDAIGRSKAVIVGKVTEHLIPHMPLFPYNPKDARFIGSPVDLIVFDGADEGELRDIIFLEIKTGDSGLSHRQRQIRGAIQAGRVLWRELRV